MNGLRIERLQFSKERLATWAQGDPRHVNWPVVYTIDDRKRVYVGESRNAESRIGQHLESDPKAGLQTVRVVIHEEFHKSAALGLESYLIRMLAGDGYQVLNLNQGVTEADYFLRDSYEKTFDKIFDALREDGLFTRSRPEIVNGSLFKFSPFKTLNTDQAVAVEDLLEGLLSDLGAGVEARSPIVIQGDPGTGKTIIAIYLMKLIRDIATTDPAEVTNTDSIFSDLFVADNRARLAPLRIGFVIPQQSLRVSIQDVFAKTPGLETSMVLTPFEVGESDEMYDLLIVDEAHRLNRRANQASGPLNKKFADITTRLYGTDDHTKTQLDWIRSRSRHQILLLDSAQRVRPADLPKDQLETMFATAKKHERHYRLLSQLRVQAGADYIDYVRRVLSPHPPARQSFTDHYDFRLFEDLDQMHDEVRRKEKKDGLARLIAGFAWPWKSKKDPDAYDIEIGTRPLRWNRAPTDWINSPGAVDEVGSIHTVQGYDLNYAGVIIGPDLRYDATARRLFIDRASYHDVKGKENNRRLGLVNSDDDLLEYITNIYGVLLTRGIKGTYVYVCDPALRAYLRPFFG